MVAACVRRGRVLLQRPRNECGLEADQLACRRAQEARAGRVRQLICVQCAQRRFVIRWATDVFRHIRYDRCASNPRSRPSSSRWLASNRCMPSDRPSRPIATNMSAKSGCWLSSSENSSTMMNKVGQRSQLRCQPGAHARTRRAGTARRSQQLLPAVHFTGQRIAHPGDQRRLLGEVGDDRGHVWRSSQVEKCCAAFEVDEEKVEHFRRIARHHAQRDRCAAAPTCLTRWRPRRARVDPCRVRRAP